jgi:hypothetical protein
LLSAHFGQGRPRGDASHIADGMAPTLANAGAPLYERHVTEAAKGDANDALGRSRPFATTNPEPDLDKMKGPGPADQ